MFSRVALPPMDYSTANQLGHHGTQPSPARERGGGYSNNWGSDLRGIYLVVSDGTTRASFSAFSFILPSSSESVILSSSSRFVSASGRAGGARMARRILWAIVKWIAL